MTTSAVKSYLARFSAIFLLILGMWGCGSVPSLEELPRPTSRLPFVRVLLADGARQHVIHLPNGGQMYIECQKGDKRVGYYSGRPVTVAGEKQTLALYDDKQRTLDYNIDGIIISPRGKNPRLVYDGKEYRGLLELTSSSGQIRLVNIVYVEDYLRGVVPLEIGPTPKEQIEAIKAQAVAARTYSMAHLDQFGPEVNYDLKSDVTDQLYGGVAVEDKLCNEAIEATAGMVAVYHGLLIDAYYHSTCGGSTDDIEDVWDKDSRPYLRAVQDDQACSISKYFTWQERFSADQMVMRLERYLTQARGAEIRVGRLANVVVSDRTPGGRTTAVVFETTGGHFVFNKEEVRRVVRRSDDLDALLRSASFTIDVTRNTLGEITYVTFDGHGYGHGVGMCQMGAKGLSLKGVTYDSILSLYYQGTNLKQLY